MSLWGRTRRSYNAKVRQRASRHVHGLMSSVNWKYISQETMSVSKITCLTLDSNEPVVKYNKMADFFDAHLD